MYDDSAFLRAIIAAPADDLPRLIYADALDERGDSRGEFIRLQIKLAGYVPPAHPGVIVCEGKGAPARAGSRKRCRCEPCLLVRRERALHPQGSVSDCLFGRIFNPELNTHTGPPRCRWEYRRGFVESVTLSGDDWLRYADALTAAAPLREVRLTATGAV